MNRLLIEGDASSADETAVVIDLMWSQDDLNEETEIRMSCEQGRLDGVRACQFGYVHSGDLTRFLEFMRSDRLGSVSLFGDRNQLSLVMERGETLRMSFYLRFMEGNVSTGWGWSCRLTGKELRVQRISCHRYPVAAAEWRDWSWGGDGLRPIARLPPAPLSDTKGQATDEQAGVDRPFTA